MTKQLVKKVSFNQYTKDLYEHVELMAEEKGGVSNYICELIRKDKERIIANEQYESILEKLNRLEAAMMSMPTTATTPEIVAKAVETDPELTADMIDGMMDFTS